MKCYTDRAWSNQAIITFLLLSIMLLLASGCAVKAGADSPGVKKSAQERKARRLYEQGQYSDAARAYQRLAQQPSERQDVLHLQAAQAFLKIPRDDKAKKNLDLVRTEKLSTAQLSHLHLMYAQIDINAGNVEQALDFLRRISVSSLSHSRKAEYYKLTAFAYGLTKQIVKSVHERVALDLYLRTQQERDSNNRAISELLSLMPEQTLQQQRRQPQQSIIYSGWLSLEHARRQFPVGVKQQEALNDWADQYPGHPAQALISSGYFQVSRFKLANVRVIAVFLPESGPYRSYAAALKAGFVAAYERDHTSVRPTIRFYDTQQADILTIYRRAVADGAQLIIGPLNKKHIKALVERNDLTVPVMALNYVEGLVKSNLYQFALSPLDEVQQSVKQARLAGHRNAIILAPQTADGERLSQYFQQTWEANGGNVLRLQSFDPKARDFSFPVREMLSINESQSRLQQVQKIIGVVEYQPRRRQDVDVIFLAASEKHARLINPQFYHNRAGSVAVYGLAKLYQGYADKNKDIDLEGVNFCTIPWLFAETYQSDLSRASLQEIEAQFPRSLLSLIAFGIDAYAVVAHLNELADIPFYGAAGDLLLNGSNRIERHLVCARFKDGEAVLVEMAEEHDVETPVQDVFPVNAL